MRHRFLILLLAGLLVACSSQNCDRATTDRATTGLSTITETITTLEDLAGVVQDTIDRVCLAEPATDLSDACVEARTRLESIHAQLSLARNVLLPAATELVAVFCPSPGGDPPPAESMTRALRTVREAELDDLEGDARRLQARARRLRR